MEEVLKNLRKNVDNETSNAVIQLLKVYVNNVVRNPSNIKYRKIKISNAKFHSVIWSVEDARSFLLLAGFEENGDFLMLPEDASLDGARLILDNITLDDKGLSSSKNKTSQTTSLIQPATSSNSLKLRKSTDCSLFDEVTKADMTLLSYMKEMGFDVSLAEKALIITKNKGIQPAMDWINSNPTKVDEIKMAGFRKQNESLKIPESDGPVIHTEQQTTEGAPVSRFQVTIDERHKFQEKQRLEAIEAARLEKAEEKRQKEYLLKNLEDEKRERREKGERIKCMRMGDSSAVTTTGETSDQSTISEEENNDISLKLRLPDGKVTTLKVHSQSPLKRIYKHITSTCSDLKEEDFTVMTISPQRKFTEKEKSIGELGLRSQETLIVQRVDQTTIVTQGHGEIFQVLEIAAIDQWETILQQNNDKLIVIEFYVSWSAECKRGAELFESLNAEYGIDKKVLFLRVNTECVSGLNGECDISALPMYKLIWNKKTLCDVKGLDKEKLDTVIRENVLGPAPERVNNDMCEDYFDPR